MKIREAKPNKAKEAVEEAGEEDLEDLIEVEETEEMEIETGTTGEVTQTTGMETKVGRATEMVKEETVDKEELTLQGNLLHLKWWV